MSKPNACKSGGGPNIWRDQRGASAAEFALSLPFLVAMMFAFIESGRYIEHIHVVTKAVRDGVRYAARQPFADYGCTPGASLDLNSTDVGGRIKRYVRTGSTNGTEGRLDYWSSDATVTVTAICSDAGPGVEGIYTQLVGGAPVIEIHANVPYVPVAAALGWHLDMPLFVRAEGAWTG